MRDGLGDPGRGSEQPPPPHVLIWHANYSELKAVKSLWTQEKLLPSLNYLEESKPGAGVVFPRIRVISRDKC